MVADRRAHRSHVSYIDKSRNYYGAQGYPQAYQWSYNHHVPFAPLTKPLNECRVGLVTTSFFEKKVDKDAVAGSATKEPYAARCDDALGGLYNKDLFWDKDNKRKFKQFKACTRHFVVNERFHQKRIAAKVVTFPHFDPKKTRVRS